MEIMFDQHVHNKSPSIYGDAQSQHENLDFDKSLWSSIENAKYSEYYRPTDRNPSKEQQIFSLQEEQHKEEGRDTVKRLELYGVAVAIIGSIVAATWTIRGTIDDKVESSRQELTGNIQTSKAEIMATIQNNQSVLQSRIDNTDQKLDSTNQSLYKVLAILESQKDKRSQ